MPMWHEAADALGDALKGVDEASLTVDQKLKVAEIKALLSIGQELSIIHNEGINPAFERD